MLHNYPSFDHLRTFISAYMLYHEIIEVFMIDELKNLGKKIREQRKLLGISQAELAELADIHGKQIYRIESGKCSPSIITTLKIIKVLKMDIRVIDINNLNNFNPIKDEIYSMLENATDEELVLYRNIIETIKRSQKITTKVRQEIKKTATAKQKELIT